MLRVCTVFLVGLGLMMTSLAAHAASTPKYVEGVHYRVLETQGVIQDPSKIEVREFFSYICPHCYHLESKIESWLKTKPDNVNFVRTPVTFLRHAKPLARAWYVEQALGVTDQLNEAIFDAIHKDHKPLYTEDALADFFAAHGVDKAKFNKLYGSFGVSTKVRQADALARDYQIHGVPTLVVNGLYVVLPQHLSSLDEEFDVADFLINKLDKERAAANQ